MSKENEIWTISKVINWTSNHFKTNEIESPRLSAEVLMTHCLGCSRIDLYLKHDQPLNKSELEDYKKLLNRRLNNEPIAYIVGKKEFWSMEFFVSPNVLIPRPETECLVEKSIELISDAQDLRILELGVGSGAVIISIASQHLNNEYYATDVSEKAISIAKKNARVHLPNHDIIHFIKGEWLEPLENQPFFDMILSNPPYIASKDIEKLQPEVSLFEPRLALDGGIHGLDSIEIIINKAYNHLTPKGFLVIEIGFDQRDAVFQIANSTGMYENISCEKDYAGFHRIVAMQKKHNETSDK